jgi:GTP-binding protein EngB required for normal cell division
MTELLETLDLLDLTIARASGIASADDIEQAAQVAKLLRIRQDFLGDHLVIALAGGTGAGKSSLLNAIAATQVASTSELRPHTDEPLAWAPEEAWGPIGPMLDELGIGRRAVNETLPGVVLVDLPDLDSIAAWHRRTVEHLLPRVDAVVWVFDPIKYHDPVVHQEFLRALAGYGDQFTFVLNKIDRLGAEAEAVRADLVAILIDDGFPDPEVFATVAVEDPRLQRGIEPLRRFLGERLDAKRTAVAKIAEDIRGAARSLASGPRLWSGAGISYPDVLVEARRSAEDAGARWQAIVEHIAPLVGPETGSRLRDAVATSAPDEVEHAVTAILWDRALLGATIASLAVSARTVHADLRGTP